MKYNKLICSDFSASEQKNTNVCIFLLPQDKIHYCAIFKRYTNSTPQTGKRLGVISEKSVKENIQLTKQRKAPKIYCLGITIYLQSLYTWQLIKSFYLLMSQIILTSLLHAIQPGSSSIWNMYFLKRVHLFCLCSD